MKESEEKVTFTWPGYGQLGISNTFYQIGKPSAPFLIKCNKTKLSTGLAGNRTPAAPLACLHSIHWAMELLCLDGSRIHLYVIKSTSRCFSLDFSEVSQLTELIYSSFETSSSELQAGINFMKIGPILAELWPVEVMGVF